MEEERVREKIADIIFYDKLPKDYGECFEKATQILAIKGIRIEAEDQSLPAYTRTILNQNPQELLAQARDDMLKPNSKGNVWVKVRPKKE